MKESNYSLLILGNTKADTGPSSFKSHGFRRRAASATPTIAPELGATAADSDPASTGEEKTSRRRSASTASVRAPDNADDGGDDDEGKASKRGRAGRSKSATRRRRSTKTRRATSKMRRSSGRARRTSKSLSIGSKSRESRASGEYYLFFLSLGWFHSLFVYARLVQPIRETA